MPIFFQITNVFKSVLLFVFKSVLHSCQYKNIREMIEWLKIETLMLYCGMKF